MAWYSVACVISSNLSFSPYNFHPFKFFLNNFYLFIYDSHREREAETQAEGVAGSMHRVPDVGFDPGSPGTRPGPKSGTKQLRHPGIPQFDSFLFESIRFFLIRFDSIRFFFDLIRLVPF